jgi:hypothetical protein
VGSLYFRQLVLEPQAQALYCTSAHHLGGIMTLPSFSRKWGALGRPRVAVDCVQQRKAQRWSIFGLHQPTASPFLDCWALLQDAYKEGDKCALIMMPVGAVGTAPLQSSQASSPL